MSRRAIAIIRVSREGGRGDDLLSPDIQRGSIVEHCERRGLRIVDWVEAVDESGSQDRSGWWARLDATVARVEAGEAEVVVAWKFSRLARNRLKWAIAVDRIERAGGSIESSTENVDTSTVSGRFTRGMLAEMNAFQAESIGASWKETHVNRLKRGLPINGRPRFGYRYDVEAKRHRVDPVTGPVLAEAYRRYVAGDSMYALVRWIQGTGTHPVSYGIASAGHWTDNTLRRVLDSGFGAGLLNRHDPECRKPHATTGNCRRREFLPGAHEPVIDADTWAAFRAARADRGRPVAARSERSPYLLSRLVRCASDVDGEPCGGTMIYAQTGPRSTGPQLICLNRRRAMLHAGGYMAAHHVEADVVAWMRTLAADVEGAVTRAEADRASRGNRIAILDQQIAAAREDRERQTRRYMADRIAEDVWDGLKVELDDAVTALERRRDRVAEEERAIPEVVAAEALEDWEELPVEHRRAVLRRLIDHIEVTPGFRQRVEGAPNGSRRGTVQIFPR